MRPRQFILKPQDVEECASSILQDNVKLKDTAAQYEETLHKADDMLRAPK